MSKIFSYDPAELKRSLIEFYQNKPEFADFNYEGSAINTIIDNLVRNTHYIAYMANMVGTESFLDSAQLRSNIVSHAQKLSYVPKSRTATTVVADIVVVPSSPPPLSIISIIAEKGSVFISTIDNVSYTFTNPRPCTLTRTPDGKFVANDIELKQGRLVTHNSIYRDEKITIPNKDVDSSTIRVFVSEPTDQEYTKVDNIIDVKQDSRAFYLSENNRGLYDIEFGKDVIGAQPSPGTNIRVEYVIVEKEHANNISTLFAASPIEGYSNIVVDVTTKGYGGSERPSGDYIKFLAPKLYQAQNRAVRDQDYKAIMMREFPMIASANAWGGERNDPPFFGKVFLCAIPHEGFILANNVKSIIENRMRDFSMMQVEIVDPEYLFLHVNANVMYSADRITKTFADIEAHIQTIVRQYNSELKVFDNWFNHSYLLSRIQETLPEITSIEVSTRMHKKVPVLANRNARYVVHFSNAIKPKSVKGTGIKFSIDDNGSSITDDGEGNIIRKFISNNVESYEDIGSVDYDRGVLDFSALIVSENTEMDISATPVSMNVYSDKNLVVQIEKAEVRRLESRGNANG